ncbi:hypothetical protein C0J52_04641 [Blattella germanica]|nr:hypothetical protein C0J52_04641 [Blattella germanica]
MKILDECDAEMSTKYGIVEPPAEEGKEDAKAGEHVFSEAEMSYQRNKSMCFYQCLFQKIKMAKEDGTINVEEAIKQSKEALSELTDSAAWGHIEKFCPKPSTAHTLKYVCKTDSADYMECMYYMGEAFCPEAITRKSETCDAFREDVKKRYEI